MRLTIFDEEIKEIGSRNKVKHNERSDQFIVQRITVIKLGVNKVAMVQAVEESR